MPLAGGHTQFLRLSGTERGVPEMELRVGDNWNY